MAPKVFKKATKHQLKLRLALAGVSGGGKTYSALKIATHLVPNGRIAVIDTERESASLYADEFEFDTLALDSFHPGEYIEAIHAAEQAGYDVIIIDSLSHAWAGKDGLLEEVNKAEARSGGKFKAWGPAGELQNQLIDAITKSKAHVICTMRTKMEHVLEEENGRKTVRKVGMKVIQRDDVEYEFTLYADMDKDNRMIVQKSRCKALSGKIIARPGKDVADTLMAWLSDGAPEEPAPVATDWRSVVDEFRADCLRVNTTAEIEHLKSVFSERLPKGVAPPAARKDAYEALEARSRAIASAA